MIKESGLLEWWPKFINRTDLNIGNDNFRHTAPNMRGNIQILFVFLGYGFAISICCIGFELLDLVFQLIKRLVNPFILKIVSGGYGFSLKPCDDKVISIKVQEVVDVS